MELAIFQLDGLMFLLRWGHFLFGVAWIGLLWYFNFVQGPFFAETEAGVKTAATQKLVPRALWWFRWGAMFTFLTGLLLMSLKIHQAGGMGLFSTSWGAMIVPGVLMGLTMWYNVWFVIWPAQQKVIAAANGETVDNVPAIARRAFLASRTNTLFSIPMLFFMGAASHLPIQVQNPMATWFILVTVLIGAIEANALTANKGPTTEPIETIKSVITSGLVLAGVLYFIAEALL